MDELYGITLSDGGDMLAPGVRLRWSADRHVLAGNNARNKNSGTLWHEAPNEQSCTNMMPNGFMCNGHPMHRYNFIKLVHQLSKGRRKPHDK